MIRVVLKGSDALFNSYPLSPAVRHVVKPDPMIPEKSPQRNPRSGIRCREAGTLPTVQTALSLVSARAGRARCQNRYCPTEHRDGKQHEYRYVKQPSNGFIPMLFPVCPTNLIQRSNHHLRSSLTFPCVLVDNSSDVRGNRDHVVKQCFGFVTYRDCRRGLLRSLERSHDELKLAVSESKPNSFFVEGVSGSS